MTTPQDELFLRLAPIGIRLSRTLRLRLVKAAERSRHRGTQAIITAMLDELAKYQPLAVERLAETYRATWRAAVETYTPELVRPVVELARNWLNTDEAEHVAALQLRGMSETAAASIRSAMAQSIGTPKTLRAFRADVAAIIDETPLAEHQVETLYRTGVGRAYASGQVAILGHPAVSDEFPYVIYYAVHDDRVEHTHLAMESHGLDGTAIYRRTDPVIRKFWPPWRWNCRCHVVPLSVEDAGGQGLDEAREWMETGIEPRVRYVAHPLFDLPPGWQPVTATLA